MKHSESHEDVLFQVVNHVDRLEGVKDYLSMLGKIHHQIGVEAYEVMIFGACFVKAAR